jgi:hypothetical protein
LQCEAQGGELAIARNKLVLFEKQLRAVVTGQDAAWWDIDGTWNLEAGWEAEWGVDPASFKSAGGDDGRSHTHAAAAAEREREIAELTEDLKALKAKHREELRVLQQRVCTYYIIIMKHL